MSSSVLTVTTAFIIIKFSIKIVPAPKIGTMYTLPTELQNSYRESSSYPENLIPTGIATYKSRLNSYKKRLDDVEFDLCLVPTEDDVDNIFEIPIIDLSTGDGKMRDKRYIHTPEKLTQWLGVTPMQSANDPSAQSLVTRKRDPKCRFVYLYGENSRDKLKTTRQSLCDILSYHQVMPVYLDFMLVFGGQSDARDLRFSGFHEQIRLRNALNGHAVPELGRSGRQFQLCYNLKGVQFKNSSEENIKLNEWSIRDAAIYHQFDVEYGTTLWIVTKGGRDILDRYLEMVGPTGRPEDRTFQDATACFRSTLVTHLLYCHWSTEDWRWYIVWLETVVEEESAMAVNGLRGPGYAHKEYEPWDIQDLQHWQDETNMAIMVLEANVKNVRALHSFYANLVARKDFPDTLRVSCEDHLHAFFSQIDEIMGDFDTQITRAKLLAGIIKDRKELVLQHLQSQVSERTEQLNKNLEREAVVMRIVTIVTLTYLPATFVSTFFSTDVIKYQDQDQSCADYANGSFSQLALNRWLQVTIPLTVLTLFGAWSTFRFYDTTAGRLTFSERMKRIIPGLTSLKTAPSADAATHCQSDVNTRSDAIRNWVNSVTKFARTMHWPRGDRAMLPFQERVAPKAG